MKHGNISVFVPFNGCPHQCSFCNQRSITGVKYQPTVQDVDKAVEAALLSKRSYDYEIAFFGGSFTAINREYMVSLLGAAYKYVKDGTVSGIRLSTRPDAVDMEIMEILCLCFIHSLAQCVAQRDEMAYTGYVARPSGKIRFQDASLGIVFTDTVNQNG